MTPAEDEAFKELEHKLSAAGSLEEMQDVLTEATRHEEWHITVKGDPLLWAQFCRENGLKPLFLEMPNHTTQLLSASSFDPRPLLNEVLGENERALFTVIRVKHEVSLARDSEKPVYYEAHVKFNGPFRTDRKGASRDLYRTHEQRWYLTHRQSTPFAADAFAAKAVSLAKPSRFDAVEYEAVLIDTNPALDGGWL